MSNKDKAIVALIENHTVTAAAANCGLSRKTIYRYLADPAFRAALREREAVLIDTATLRLLGMVGAALDALESVLADPDQPGATNLRLAAGDVLKLLVKLREVISTEDRLANLEKAVYSDT